MQDYQTQFITSMELKGFARSTQRNYLAHLDRFHRFCRKHPDACGYDDVRAFLHDAIKRRKLSSAYVNSSYAALKFYYETTLTVQTVFHTSANQAGIKKRVSVHSLRHAFSTHLLNRGANILQIKELLGHESIQTTSKYLHLTHAQVLGVTSPLDHEEGDSRD